jgi:hypothetical protein
MHLLNYNFTKKLFMAALGILSFLIIISLIAYKDSNQKYMFFKKMYYDNSQIANIENNNIAFFHVSFKGYYERFSKFNGIKTICKINAYEYGDIRIDTKLSFNGGNFKIVLVLPNGEIKTISEFTEKNKKGIFSTKEVRTSEFRLPKGISYIKIVGFNAKLSYNIKVSKVDVKAKAEILME